MGTSGSYSGSGSKAGKALRSEVKNWLNNPGQAPSVSHGVRLFRSRYASDVSSGAIGSGRHGGAQRSAVVSARTAGRAAAAAYAYATGDRQTLSDLGLNYDELREYNSIDLINKIVSVACGPNSDGTIEEDEQRWVAAELADWIIEQQNASVIVEPDEIAGKAFACIVHAAIATETGELIRSGNPPPALTELDDNELQKMAEVVADRAGLSNVSVTEREFADAIENGIETVRDILGLSPDA